MSEYLAVQRVVIVASEDSPPNPGEAYDAVEALLEDVDGDIVYLDTNEDDAIITKDTSEIGAQVTRGSSDGTPHAILKGAAEVSFEFPLKAFLGSGEAPAYGPVLHGAGFAQEVDADDMVYTRATKNPPAFTIYEYQRSAHTDNWRLEVATGVRGNLSFDLDNESEATASFEGRGNFHEITDEAEFIDPATGEIALLKDGSTAVTATSFSQPSLDPMPCRDMIAQFDTDTYEFSAVEFDVNHESDDVNAVTGSSSRQRGATTRGAEDRTEGSGELVGYTEARINDVRDKAYGGDKFAWLMELENGDGKIEFQSPAAQFLPWEKTTNGNLRAYSIPFRLNGTDGLVQDDELTITYMPPS